MSKKTLKRWLTFLLIKEMQFKNHKIPLNIQQNDWNEKGRKCQVWTLIYRWRKMVQPFWKAVWGNQLKPHICQHCHRDILLLGIYSIKKKSIQCSQNAKYKNTGSSVHCSSLKGEKPKCLSLAEWINYGTHTMEF